MKRKLKDMKNKRNVTSPPPPTHVHAVISELGWEGKACKYSPNYGEHFSKLGKLNKAFPFLTDNKVAIIDP